MASRRQGVRADATGLPRFSAGDLRYYVMDALWGILDAYRLTSLYTLSVTNRLEGTVKRRHLTIGLFGIAMVILIALQVPGQRRAGQRGQGGVPFQYEPRDPHADERYYRAEQHRVQRADGI